MKRKSLIQAEKDCYNSKNVVSIKSKKLLKGLDLDWIDCFLIYWEKMESIKLFCHSPQPVTVNGSRGSEED